MKIGVQLRDIYINIHIYIFQIIVFDKRAIFELHGLRIQTVFVFKVLFGV